MITQKDKITLEVNEECGHRVHRRLSCHQVDENDELTIVRHYSFGDENPPGFWINRAMAAELWPIIKRFAEEKRIG